MVEKDPFLHRPGTQLAVIPQLQRHFRESIRLPDGFLIVALYVVAVCGPLMVSGYRHVAIFGIVNLIAVENLRSRFNATFAIGSTGFSEGMACARMEPAPLAAA